MRAGIICDLEYSRHISFKNYFYAIEYLYHGVKLITSSADLDYIDILFIGDDHYGKHRNVFSPQEFIDKCNNLGIIVVVFTTEKTFGSVFAWNEDGFHHLKKFKYLHFYMTDVDDCILTGAKLNRTLPSRHFANPKQVDVNSKLDQMVFIGNVEGYIDCYKQRKETLKKIQELIPLVVIPSNISFWDDYMNVLSQYRFVLAPKGNCNAFSLRFYDALMVHSIPVQEVSKNTLSLFDIEEKFDDCIFFQEPEEIPDKLKECPWQYSHSEIWMEDYLQKILKEDGLL
jgi:hypothetical protein